MKVKLLRKLRKRFEWKWDEFHGVFRILDREQKTSDLFNSSQYALSHMYDLLTFSSLLFTELFIEDLTTRFNKRDKRVRYYQSLKRLRQNQKQE